MKAEKSENKYFTESYQMIEDIWNKIMSEETEGEPLSDKEKSETASIIKRVQEEKTQFQNILDPEKNQQFDRLTKMAQILAERCLLDVFIEKTADHIGTIRFHTKYLFITQEMPFELRNIFASLIMSSSSLSISHLSEQQPNLFVVKAADQKGKERLIEIVLVYDLNTKI